MVDIVVFVVTYIIMASQFAVAKVGYAAGLTPWDVVVIRYAGAAICTLPFLALPSVRAALVAKPLPLMWLSIFGGLPYGILLAAGIEAAPTIHGAVIIPAMTVTVSFTLSALLLGMIVTRDRVVGVLATVLGLVLFGLGAGATLTQGKLTGDLLFVGAGLFWALFTVMQRRWQLDPLPTITAIGLGGVPGVIIFAALFPSGLTTAPPSMLALQAVFHGPLHTCLSFYLYGLIVRRLGAPTAALGIASVPPIGAAIGFFLLHETPPALQWAGIACVVTGIAVASGMIARLLGRRHPVPAQPPSRAGKSSEASP